MAKILVMEDDMGDAYFLQRALSVGRHRIIMTDGATAAYEQFKQDVFDLVITDVLVRKYGRPVTDGGVSLVRMIRTGWVQREVPIIAVTGAGVFEDKGAVQRALLDSVQAVVMKPYRTRQIIDSVNEVLSPEVAGQSVE